MNKLVIKIDGNELQFDSLDRISLLPIIKENFLLLLVD